MFCSGNLISFAVVNPWTESISFRVLFWALGSNSGMTKEAFVVKCYFTPSSANPLPGKSCINLSWGQSCHVSILVTQCVLANRLQSTSGKKSTWFPGCRDG